MSVSVRKALDERVLAWMAEAKGLDFARDEARFDELALALFRFQFGACAAYRRFCEGRGATPDRVEAADAIPAVPAAAFKELRLACFDAEETRHVFRTSGTSGGRRGALELDTLALYEASLLPTFERHLLCDLPGEPVAMQVLAPSPEELPDSSLSHMFGVVMRRRGTPESGFRVRAGELEVEATLDAIAPTSAHPLLLCGTAFAFVHLLDALAERGLSRERSRARPLKPPVSITRVDAGSS
ncbi:MAG: hypothetical protein QNK05_12250, partial [Myxococcota bacterium]|nr:hypothetical protein [Myxococcota bacterium]